MSALKVGLIVDGERLTKQIHEFVHWARSSGDIQVTHLIVQQRPVPAHRPLWVKILRKSPAELTSLLLWRLKDRIEQRRVEALQKYRGSSAAFAAGSTVPGRIFVKPLVSRSGFVHRFSENDLESIRQERFDLLLRCGSGILRGGILTAARLGI